MRVIYTVKEGDEKLSSHCGLALIGALINRTGLRDRLNRTLLMNCKEPKISHADMVFAMTGLLCLGKPDYDAIEPFRDNPFFSQSLGLEACPSSPALRQRVDVIGNAFDTIIKEESADLVRRTAPRISPVKTSCGDFVPLDVDVSPFDNSKTSKQGVSRTYKGYDGYSPIFAYIGKEGYLANLELREGSQHCQKNTPQFLKASIQYAKRITDQKLLLRLDSGNDSADNIDCCVAQKVDFIIKRNLRKEDPNAWLKLAMEIGTPIACREGKKLWRGKTHHDLAGNPLVFPIFFEVTERATKKGQPLLFPEVTVDTYWVSLDLDPYEAIVLYHDHGTSEQFHSELKSDMDLERLPSERFSSNAVVLLLGMFAYNMLRLCGQESLREDNGNVERIPEHRKKAQRRRVRTVILDFIYMAGRVIHTSRKWFISFGRMNPLASLWESIYQSFVSETT
jgi:Transposase DDE domain group 1